MRYKNIGVIQHHNKGIYLSIMLFIAMYNKEFEIEIKYNEELY